MKKEILIAGLIGLLIGLVVVGIYFINQSTASIVSTILYNPLIENFPLINNSKIKFSNGQDHQIILISPTDQSLVPVNQTTINISGRTSPESIIILLYETGEKSTIADNEGNFEVTAGLINGENEITIKSFSPSGSLTEKRITLVVSSFEF